MQLKCMKTVFMQIILLISLPTFITIIICIGGILITLNECQTVVSEYANYIYQKQIDNTKRHNGALLFQLNSQFQKMSWQINLLNQFHNKVINNKVKQNTQYLYRNNIHNIDRSYHNDEDEMILNLFHKSKLLTSVWHTPNIAYLDELDYQSNQQIQYASSMDSIWRAIMYDNQLNDITKRKLRIRDIYLAFEYDGMVYMTSTNTTYENLVLPPDCPRQKYVFDIRCRYYYKDTKDSISLRMFEPNLFYTDGDPFVASVLCQRLMKYNSNNDPSLYSQICNSIDLSELPEYFSNFNKDSSIQVVIDPISLKVVYHSQLKLERQQIDTLNEISLIQPNIKLNLEETDDDKKRDLEEHNRLIEFIQANYKKWELEKENRIDMIQVQDNQPFLNTFEFNYSQGDDYFIIMNVVKLIDKIPRDEVMRKGASKYQIENSMLFMDILSKQVLTKDMTKLKEDVNNFFIYYVLGSIVSFVSILAFTIIRAQIISLSIIRGVEHLTKVLSKIKLETGEDGDLQFADLIDNNLNTKYIFLSKDMMILYESFQNLFKTLHYTTSNIYSEDDGNNLLNLNIQMKYFEQFQNYRALGVCNNNIGNIHMNAGRYFEAMECYQKAIIYSHYELKTYEESYCFEYYAEFQQNHQNLSQIHSRNASLSKFECRSEKSDRSEKDIYSWNLFNRKMNYLKAFLAYLNENNQDNLWHCAENLIDELIYLSKCSLFKCYSRTIILLYYKSITLFMQGKQEQYEINLQKAILKYNKYISCKNKILNSAMYNPSLILNSNPSRVQFQVGQKQNKPNSRSTQHNHQSLFASSNLQMNKILSPSQVNRSSAVRLFSSQTNKDKALSNFSNARVTTHSIVNDNQPKTLAEMSHLLISKNLQDNQPNPSIQSNQQSLNVLQATNKGVNQSHHRHQVTATFLNKQQIQQQQQQQQQLSSHQLQVKSTQPTSLSQMKSQQSKYEIGNSANACHILTDNEINNNENIQENDINLNNIKNQNNLQNQKLSVINQPNLSVTNLNELDKKPVSSNIQLLYTQDLDTPLKIGNPSMNMLTNLDQTNINLNQPASFAQANLFDAPFLNNQSRSQQILQQENEDASNATKSFNFRDVRKKDLSFLKGYRVLSKTVLSPPNNKKHKKGNTQQKQQQLQQQQNQQSKLNNQNSDNDNLFAQKFRIQIQKIKNLFSRKKEQETPQELVKNQKTQQPSKQSQKSSKNETIKENQTNLINIRHSKFSKNNSFNKQRSSIAATKFRQKSILAFSRQRSDQQINPTQNKQEGHSNFIYNNLNNNSSSMNFHNSPNHFSNYQPNPNSLSNFSHSHYANNNNNNNARNRIHSQNIQSNQGGTFNIFQGLSSEIIQISKVKKYYNDDQVSKNILPQDVLFGQIAIQYAELLILRGEDLLAAEVLTQQLSNQKIYLQHMRYSMLIRLQRIFTKLNISSPHLKSMINTFHDNSFIKIQFISACTLPSSLKRSYELLEDIYTEILKLDKDQLGLIVYNQEDNLFTQEMSITSFKQLRSSHDENIEEIFKSIYRQFSNTPELYVPLPTQNNETTQNQDSMNNYQQSWNNNTLFNPKNNSDNNFFLNNNPIMNKKQSQNLKLQNKYSNHKEKVQEINENIFFKQQNDYLAKNLKLSKPRQDQLQLFGEDSLFENYIENNEVNQGNQCINQPIYTKKINTDLTQNEISPIGRQLLDKNAYNTNGFKSINQLYFNQQKSSSNNNDNIIFQQDLSRLNQSAAEYKIEEMENEDNTNQEQIIKMKSSQSHSTSNLQIKQKPYIFNISEFNISQRGEDSRAPFNNQKRNFFQDYEDVADMSPSSGKKDIPESSTSLKKQYSPFKFEKIDPEDHQNQFEYQNDILPYINEEYQNSQSQQKSKSIFSMQNQNQQNNQNKRLPQIQQDANDSNQIFCFPSSINSKISSIDQGLLIQNQPANKSSLVENVLEPKKEHAITKLSHQLYQQENTLLQSPLSIPTIRTNLNLDTTNRMSSNVQLQNINQEDFISPLPSQKEISNLIPFDNDKDYNSISFGSENNSPDSNRNRAQTLKWTDINLKELNSIKQIKQLKVKQDEVNMNQIFIERDIQQLSLEQDKGSQYKQQNSFGQQDSNKNNLTLTLKRTLSLLSLKQQNSPNSNIKRDSVSLSPFRNRIYSFQSYKKTSEKIEPCELQDNQHFQVNQLINSQVTRSQNEFINYPSPAFLPQLHSFKLNKDQQSDNKIIDSQQEEKKQQQLQQQEQISTPFQANKMTSQQQKKQFNPNLIFHQGMQKAISSLLLPNDEDQTYSYIQSRFQQAKQANNQSKKEQEQIQNNQQFQQYFIPLSEIYSNLDNNKEQQNDNKPQEINQDQWKSQLKLDQIQLQQLQCIEQQSQSQIINENVAQQLNQQNSPYQLTQEQQIPLLSTQHLSQYTVNQIEIKQKNEEKTSFNKQNNVNKSIISVKKFIIYVTDQQGVSQDNKMYINLISMLHNADIELLVLQLNSIESISETAANTDTFHKTKSVIKYFYSSNKLLQYIYSQRSNFNVDLYPLIIEHFQTTFLFVFIF